MSIGEIQYHPCEGPCSMGIEIFIIWIHKASELYNLTRYNILLFIKHCLGLQNKVNTSSQLLRYFNHKLYGSKGVIDRFVGDNKNLPIIDKCSVKECYKTIKFCSGLVCQCCDTITCKPNFPATRKLVNGKSTVNISNEDKNIVRLSRVSVSIFQTCFKIHRIYHYINQIFAATAIYFSFYIIDVQQ